MKALCIKNLIIHTLPFFTFEENKLYTYDMYEETKWENIKSIDGSRHKLEKMRIKKYIFHTTGMPNRPQLTEYEFKEHFRPFI